MEMLFERMEANNVAFVILNASNRWLGIQLVRDFILAIAKIMCIGTLDGKRGKMLQSF